MPSWGGGSKESVSVLEPSDFQPELYVLFLCNDKNRTRAAGVPRRQTDRTSGEFTRTYILANQRSSRRTLEQYIHVHGKQKHAVAHLLALFIKLKKKKVNVKTLGAFKR